MNELSISERLHILAGYALGWLSTFYYTSGARMEARGRRRSRGIRLQSDLADISRSLRDTYGEGSNPRCVSMRIIWWPKSWQFTEAMGWLCYVEFRFRGRPLPEERPGIIVDVVIRAQISTHRVDVHDMKRRLAGAAMKGMGQAARIAWPDEEGRERDEIVLKA